MRIAGILVTCLPIDMMIHSLQVLARDGSRRDRTAMLPPSVYLLSMQKKLLLVHFNVESSSLRRVCTTQLGITPILIETTTCMSLLVESTGVSANSIRVD
jgi:hypothetical protein